MSVTFHLLFIAACVLADKNVDRRTKLPFVADAVGNALPAPSSVPASVGSPVNLLTPDRYEFYTFDESGELVKRLMTLAEIQAIVAAGEEGESMVTFANDDQPTIAFNFSQPPSTKVHSVVTNVQNVLKAQIEAHKNKPLVQPTLDTPDVSDSWSLILPSIFGNTGVDIVPDKSSGSFTTPETETFEIDTNNYIEDEFKIKDPLSKEGNQQISNTTISQVETKDAITDKLVIMINESKAEINDAPKILSTSTTTTSLPFTTFLPIKSTPETPEISTKLSAIPTISSTIAPPSTTTSTRPFSTTASSTTTTSTTTKVITTPRTTTEALTTTRLEFSSEKHTPTVESPNNISDIDKNSEKDTIFEKVSTFIPVSTMKYVTEGTTHRSNINMSTTTTQIPIPISTVHSITTDSITTRPYFSSTVIEIDVEKNNTTTITTQSISPSTTASSTEIIAAENAILLDNDIVNMPNTDTIIEMKDNEPLIPLFDVAQSISQIASDLGGDYRPLPTVSNEPHSTQSFKNNFESKENTDIDIPPADAVNTTLIKTNENETEDNFVKISTFDPHPDIENVQLHVQETIKDDKIATTSEQTTELETTTMHIQSTTIDSILNESMEDLISQIVNEVPQHYFDPESSNNITTTENFSEAITEIDSNIKTTSEIYPENNKYTAFSTEVYSEDDVFTYTTTDTYETPTEGYTSSYNQEFLSPDGVNNNSLKEYVQISVSDSKKAPDTSTVYFDQTAFITDLPTTFEINESSDEKVINENNIKTIEESITETVTIKNKLTSITTTERNIDDIPIFQLAKTNSVKKLISTKKESNVPDNVLTPKVDELKKKIQKVNIAEEEFANDPHNSWKLIPTVSQMKDHVISKDKIKSENNAEDKNIILEFSKENQGLEVTTKDLSEDVAQFTELCNELAFRYWKIMTENVDKKRSFVLSPYSVTSMLAMMFMGARGATSGEMNEILKLDDMVTFNPHFTLKNISDSVEMNQDSGIAVSAFIRELYSDRNKGKILTFYKERAQHFYNGHVEEINFKLISDIVRRRTNLLVKRYTWGKISEYLKANTITMQPPLAAFSANIFQTDCTGSSVGGRDGEMYFVVSPNVRQRRLVPVPAVVYKRGFFAGYDPVLDATAAALGNTNSIVSTLFVMPGQQGNVVHAEDLEKLEQRLLEANPTTPTWNQLLRTLLPRIGLELQIPRFSHKSVFNISSSLRKMGLKDLFDADHADLGGLNGPSKDLFLSDMVQMTTFATCGEDIVGEQHHVEEYPESLPSQTRRTSRWANYWDEPRDYQRAFHDPHDVGDAMNLPLHLRPRQARVPSRNVQPARLKFDRPFLFFTRHNPTGMILYVGRYNPRLLP